MYKAVIFDFFGVIYSDPANRWFKKHSIERSGEYADVFKQVDRGYITIEQAFKDLERLSGQPESEIREVFGQTDMLDREVVEIIKNLKNSYKLVLLSNASSGYLRKLLAENNLDDLFDELVISSEVGVIKPDPEAFRLALENSGTSAKDAIFIDDWLINVESAEKLGITGLLFESAEKLSLGLAELGVSS